MGADIRHQRHRQLLRRRRGIQNLEGAGPQGQPRFNNLRQRRCREKGLARLRHLQGRSEPSGARTRH